MSSRADAGGSAAAASALPANGITLHCRAFGRGAPVVLVHGMACGWRSWRSQIRALAPSCRVIAYDQRGHGLSGAPDDPAAYSEEILADDLAALIRGLGLQRPAVVGLSLGGSVALALAARHPGLAGALVLAATGSGSDDVDAARQRTAEWAGIARRDGSAAYAERMLASPLLEGYVRRDGERARRHMRLLIGRHPAHGLAHVTEHVVGRRRSIYARRAVLQGMSVPTLVICGSRDGSCRRTSAFLADTIPDAEMAWLHGVGHMAPLEAPRRFNAVLRDFLARRGVAAAGQAPLAA